jgi:hypothetical protein
MTLLDSDSVEKACAAGASVLEEDWNDLDGQDRAEIRAVVVAALGSYLDRADEECPGCACCEAATEAATLNRRTVAVWLNRLADLVADRIPAGRPGSPAQIVAAITAELSRLRSLQGDTREEWAVFWGADNPNGAAWTPERGPANNQGRPLDMDLLVMDHEEGARQFVKGATRFRLARRTVSTSPWSEVTDSEVTR